MVATPQFGTAFFRGRSSGQLFPTDLYVSDVAGGRLRWDNGAGAGAGSEEWVSFSEPVILEDLALITGVADTEKFRLTANNTPLPHVVRYSVHLNTLNNRPKLMIPFKANTRISGIQIAD